MGVGHRVENPIIIKLVVTKLMIYNKNGHFKVNPLN
jgi:hypothetical protein